MSYNPSKIFNSFVIRFIMESNDKMDHKIRIVPSFINPKWSYHATIDLGLKNLNRNYESRFMDSNDMITYVINLLQLALYDDQPYNYIQIDLPNAPSVLLKPRQVNTELYGTLRQLLEQCCENWPYRMSDHVEYNKSLIQPQLQLQTQLQPQLQPLSTSVSINRHTFFDEDG